jgi:hypothetical protein
VKRDWKCVTCEAVGRQSFAGFVRGKGLPRYDSRAFSHGVPVTLFFRRDPQALNGEL